MMITIYSTNTNHTHSQLLTLLFLHLLKFTQEEREVSKKSFNTHR